MGCDHAKTTIQSNINDSAMMNSFDSLEKEQKVSEAQWQALDKLQMLLMAAKPSIDITPDFKSDQPYADSNIWERETQCSASEISVQSTQIESYASEVRIQDQKVMNLSQKQFSEAKAVIRQEQFEQPHNELVTNDLVEVDL